MDSTEIDFDEPEVSDRMSHAEFPLITRATPLPSIGAPPRQTPLPPPRPEIAPPSNAPDAFRPRESAPTPAPRAMPPRQPLPPGNPFTDAAVHAPTTRSEEQRPSDMGGGVPPSSDLRPSTVTGLERPGVRQTDPPPEFDGSRRRRMVRILVVGLVLGAAGVAWGVVRSQLHGTSAVNPGEIPSAPPVPSATTPPTATTPIPTFTAIAVDPGKVSRPPRSIPTVKPGPGRVRPKAPPQDGTIEVPDGPPDDSVPPAP
jgi:hypothetical protein